MQSTFEDHVAELEEVSLHYVTAGEGEPVVLLHGWPQTWRAWRDVIPFLAGHYKVIAPDLRGLGQSSVPPGGYDKRTIGDDVWRLVNGVLGYQSFFLVGHDWGGPVAFSIALDHPLAVRRLAILDVAIPGDGAPNISQGGRRWHHAFHQTLELPELLTEGREAVYLEWFYRNYGSTADAISEEDIQHYLKAYSCPGRMSAGFNYYRALPTDIRDNEERLRAGKLTMPVLGLGGDSGWGRRSEVVESLRRVANDVRGGVVPKCGHWMPEEQPERVAKELLAFFT